jgi:hypothetical protein
VIIRYELATANEDHWELLLFFTLKELGYKPSGNDMKKRLELFQIEPFFNFIEWF